MKLERLQRHWDEFGRRDPLWAVLTSSGKNRNRWTLDEFFETGRADVTALMTYLKDLQIDPGAERALDFGCGAGRLSRALSAHFHEVLGVDIAPSMIALAADLNRAFANCRFILNERDDLQWCASSSVDVVYSRLALQHVHPAYTRRYLAEFMRVLRPGGVLVFQLPSNEIPPVEGRGLKRLLPLALVGIIRRIRAAMVFPRMEIHGLARDETVALLQRHGGRVLDVVSDQSHGVRTPGYQYCVIKQPLNV